MGYTFGSLLLLWEKSKDFWLNTNYVLIDTENESGTKNETVTVQEIVQIWLQMTEVVSHMHWETGGTGAPCINIWKVSKEMM